MAPRAAPEQVISPMIPDNNPTLINNRWRIVEATYQGNPVVFEAVGPIHIAFLPVGTLNINADCPPGGAYRMVAENTSQYRLYSGEFAPMLCGEPIDSQFDQVMNILEDTTRFELEGQRLFLLGEDGKITLEVDNPP
ncbi:MAG: META domain-containing protein [Caldilineaceae bacterium]|jgi:hypothetical protein|nr:META domain-containing protein [Caldilineaceae bacterium]